MSHQSLVSDQTSNNPIVPSSTDVQSVPKIRPWPRFWARWIDLQLTGLLLGLVLPFVAPAVLEWPTLALAALIAAVHIMVESIWIGVLATTPGKWLLQVHLTDDSLRPISLGSALSRSFEVWWRGIACGVPLVSVYTTLVAKDHLMREGITPWDRRLGITVRQQQLSRSRIAVAVLVVLGFSLFEMAEIGSSNVGTWQTFNGDGFTVRMPSEPAREVFTLRAGTVDIEQVRYMVEHGSDAYMVAYSLRELYSLGGIDASDADRFLDNSRDGAVRATGGRVIQEKKIIHQGNPGRDVDIRLSLEGSGDMLVTLRLILTSKRFYILGVTRPVFRQFTAPVGQFFESFGVH